MCNLFNICIKNVFVTSSNFFILATPLTNYLQLPYFIFTHKTQSKVSQCGEADIVETEACSGPICCAKLEWSEWSACSTSCGAVSISIL